MENKVKHPEKYVVLEHLTLPDRGFRFWTTNSDDNTHGHNGELWYKEILFTNNEYEAIDAASHHGDTAYSSELEEYYKKLHEKRNK